MNTNREEKLPKEASLAFFGKVNASISHELKNILAVISETAGLLSDLIEAAKAGRNLEPDTLNSCANTIVDEVQRGFATIRQMNRFAHSTDEPFSEVDLGDVVELMVNLSMFLSYSGTVRIDSPKDGSTRIYTRPFALQELIYESLIFAYKSTEPGAPFQIGIEETQNGQLAIKLTGLGNDADPSFPGESLKKISDRIEAQIFRNDSSNAVTITLPKDIGKTDS